MINCGRRPSSLAGMASAGILSLVLTAAPALAQSQNGAPLLPPNAKPGECYARVLVPEQYQATTQRVLKREGGEQIEVVPAKFETVEEQIVVKEAETRLEAVPAEYETTTEQVLIKPGYTTWKLGRGPIEKIDASTGEIMCLVEVPPEYATVEKTVLRTPATVRSVETPAEVITVTKEVMVEPPTTRTIEVPAEYETVKVQRQIEPARETRTKTEPEFMEVTQSVKAADSYLEWRPILCETNTTPDVVSRVQIALGDAGYDPGPSDGSLGGQTLEAIEAYQRDQGIASGQLTMETLERLGVSP